MEEFLPNYLIDILTTSIVFSSIMVIIIQKLKTLSIIKKDWQIWIIDLFLSFIIGIPFAVRFYELGVYDGAWVAMFSFVGAPAIYDVLKNQTIINYKPSKVENKKVEVSSENLIKR